MSTSTMQAPECKSPNFLSTLLEARAPLEWMTTAFKLPGLLRAAKGDKRPILLAPGYLTDKYSMRPLKAYLNYLGYSAFDWDLGRNMGDVDQDIVRLGHQIGHLFFEQNQQPITLIGWSLGGVLVREAARLYPEWVREVITLGTPITGGPKYTAPGKRFAKRKGINLDEFEKHVLERNLIGFDQPVTSIYSKSDGIVGWQASIDVYNKQARNIQVHSSHLGLGVNPMVWKEIAKTLAKPKNAAAC